MMASVTNSRFDVRPTPPSGRQFCSPPSSTPKLSVFITAGDENDETTALCDVRNSGPSAVVSNTNWTDASFSHDTLETMPRASHYAMPDDSGLSSRTTKRRTLEALQEGLEESSADELFHRSGTSPNLYFSSYPVATDIAGVVPDENSLSNRGRGQFDWFNGVFVRCLLNFCGIVLFWRLSWIVGIAGVLYTSGLIIFTILISVLTALSVAAVYSNVVVRTGDAYFIISRSLGPEFGGAVGFLLTTSNALLAAFNLVGVAEAIEATLVLDFRFSVFSYGGPLNDIRIIGCVLLAVLFVTVVAFDRHWEARIQPVFLGLVTLTLFNFLVGTFRPSDAVNELAELEPNKTSLQDGFTGFDMQTIQTNLWPSSSFISDPAASLMKTFIVLFPMAAGVVSGIDIAGDLLRDAPNAVPHGTLKSLGAAGVLYMGCAWLLAATVARGALDGSSMSLVAVDGCDAGPCPHAVFAKYRSMEHASFVGPLLIPGFFIAALASARTACVCAARIFYAVCGDRLFPYVHIFGILSSPDSNKHLLFRKSSAPVRAYAAVYAVICAVTVGIADVNTIAWAVSVVLLMLFALLSYACFDASLSESPGFRPRFVPYYSKWTALAGALLSVAAAFAVSWQTSLAIVFLIAALSVYVYRVAKPAAAGGAVAGAECGVQQHDWGTSWDANVYRRALAASLRLIRTVDHVKTYRPQALILTGFPASRPALVDLVAAFTNNEQALMMCGNIIVMQKKTMTDDLPTGAVRKLNKQLTQQAYEWLERRRVNAFYAQLVQPSNLEQESSTLLRQGARALMEGVGLGKLRPNVVIMGYLTNFSTRKFADIYNYVGTISDAFDCNMGVGLLKMSRIGMDLQDVYAEQQHAYENEHDDSATSGAAAAAVTDVSFVNELVDVGGKSRHPIRHGHHHKFRQQQRRPSVPANASHFTSSSPPPPAAVPHHQHRRARRSSEQYGNSGAAAAVGTSSDDETKWPSSSEQLMQNLSANQEVLLEKVKQASYFARQLQQQHQLLAMPRAAVLLSPTIPSSRNSTTITTQTDSLVLPLPKAACIHVWWLYDDGGLTVLIPYLLARKWKLPLHLFYLNPASNVAETNDTQADAQADKNAKVTEKRRKASRVDNSQRKMLRLLHKFRISVEHVTPITVDKWPAQEAEKMLAKVIQRMGRYYCATATASEKTNNLLLSPPVATERERTVSPSMQNDNAGGGGKSHDAGAVTEAEFDYNRDKTLRQLKLCQLVQQHSGSAALVVLSLPMYRQSVSPAMYAMWLECLTGGMTHRNNNNVGAVGEGNVPPMLLLRGNQQSVLTFDL